MNKMVLGGTIVLFCCQVVQDCKIVFKTNCIVRYTYYWTRYLYTTLSCQVSTFLLHIYTM